MLLLATMELWLLVSSCCRQGTEMTVTFGYRRQPASLTRIATKEAPRTPKNANESLNKTRPTNPGRQFRDFLQTWAPTCTDSVKGWILSSVDGCCGVSKVVTYVTVHNQPSNCIAIDCGSVQCEACVESVQQLVDRKKRRQFDFFHLVAF